MEIKVTKKLIEINIKLMSEEAQYILDDLNSCDHALYNNTEEFRKELQDALQGCDNDE